MVTQHLFDEAERRDPEHLRIWVVLVDDDQLEITGARWSLAGAEAVLRLRAVRSSGDFEAYWRFHLQQEYLRHHAALYADEAAA